MSRTPRPPPNSPVADLDIQTGSLVTLRFQVDALERRVAAAGQRVQDLPEVRKVTHKSETATLEDDRAIPGNEATARNAKSAPCDTEISTYDARIAACDAEIAALRAENAVLRSKHNELNSRPVISEKCKKIIREIRVARSRSAFANKSGKAGMPDTRCTSAEKQVVALQPPSKGTKHGGSSLILLQGPP